jgi:hypothetical protein
MWSKYMAKARFTNEQIEQAKAWFFEDENLSIEWGLRPGAGLNGPITVYNKVVPNGNDEAPSE